jgi:hypothetical protein
MDSWSTNLAICSCRCLHARWLRNGHFPC